MVSRKVPGAAADACHGTAGQAITGDLVTEPTGAGSAGLSLSVGEGRNHQTQHQVWARQYITYLPMARWIPLSQGDKGYEDYYEKVTTYVSIISGPAQVQHSGAQAFAPRHLKKRPLFRYWDTATSRGRHRTNDRETGASRSPVRQFTVGLQGARGVIYQH